ncbi:hypothetical protein [Xanthomonas citri]|uniref:hypothetical protein n=1 Tax=Xanthomonas citri TaxID=346 RepID=UPI00058EA92E|nr:hypothetical protein [Xanthomonas citri]
MQASVDFGQRLRRGFLVAPKRGLNIEFVEHHFLHWIRRAAKPRIFQFRSQLYRQNRALPDIGAAPTLARAGFKLSSDDKVGMPQSDLWL